MAIQVKHSKVSTIPDTDDTSLVRPSDWNADHTLTGTIDITNGGTGASTATGAINNLLPTQTGQSGKYLGTDGTNPQWLTVPSAGGGSSVSYYLNGGTNQGTFGGNTYYQMSKTAVTGTSANFTIAANGYITQFLTDANDPALLNIPAGNWNFEMFFAASSAGGTPSFYVELYKYNGTTFTLIASGSTSPESITGGTVKDVYTTALAVPATSLSLTDRLAVRVYVNNSGRTITLYTQDANLCQVVTTFSTGITALNGLTAQVQTFATGTTGTDFNISSATSTHTFNIPSSSASNRGLLTSADWTTFNNKANAFTYTTNYIPYGQGTTTPAQSANLTFNGTTLTANDITDSSLTSGRVTYAGTGGNLRDASNFTYDGTNLQAGAIQNTPIGSTTASTGSFTTLNSTGGALNGTIGATTPDTGAFTTLTASGVTTLGANGSNNQTFVASAGTGAFPNIVTSHQSGIARLAASYPTGNSSLMLSARGTGGSIRLVTNLYTDEQVRITHTGSAVNYINMTGSALGVAPVISAQGSDTNIPLVLQPKGTGALQAQQTDSTATGGNARGANAVDWQTERNTAAQVASASYGMISGGYRNTVSGSYSAIGGGFSNTASATGCGVFGGNSNTASSNRAFVVGGQANTAGGFYNFIGGGWTNSGTANAAVTTQSGTMNATTAVTLSGSNANIKVGQYITGTSIDGDTYVAAISGTSLTLSKNASGSSTSTLSFFTPHGIVVGGGNNQATGSYSFIGGGGDAGTAANRNVASGDWSFVGGGLANTASGFGAFVGGGGFTTSNTASGNTSSGISSVVIGGINNTASGAYSLVSNGAVNAANAIASSVVGGYRGTTRSIQGNVVLPASITPIANTNGVQQAALLILGRETTDATATVLTSNTSAAGTTNQVILPNNSAYYFKIEVIAGVTGAGNTKAWELKGAIKRGANAASTTLVGAVTSTVIAADAGALAWTLTATADTTNGGIAVTATGQASTTIRWVARVTTTEMTF